MSNKDCQLSKSLSWILRHGAKKEGIYISPEGYIDVSTLLQHKSFKNIYDQKDIERVVANSDKQRFKLQINHFSNLLQIKANQGHSIRGVRDVELTPIVECKYQSVVHGTYYKNWSIIKVQGLSRMTRNHIHFSKGTLNDRTVISGIRKGVEVYIFIDLDKALKDGLKFYESENGVILTPGNEKGILEPKYFSKVVDVNSGFPSGTMSGDLYRVFSKFGVMRVLNVNNGTATIWFQSSADAIKALESTTTNVCGHFVKVTPHEPVLNIHSNYVLYNKKVPKIPSPVIVPTTVPATAKPQSDNNSITVEAPSAPQEPTKPEPDKCRVQEPTKPTRRKRRPKLNLNAEDAESIWKQRQGSRQKWWHIDGYRPEEQTPLIEPSDLDLTGDFNTQIETIINSIRLTREEVERLYSLYLDVENCLQSVWPGCVAVPFGSITTGLGIKTSDADCFVKLPVNRLPATSGHVLQARDALLRHPDVFSLVLAIPNAATPIVKCLHLPTATHCDISFRSPLGVRNSRLVAHLLAADDKFGPLALLLKYWARTRHISGSGKITNYALVLLLIFYLQCVGRLPPVRTLQSAPHAHSPAGPWDAGFCDDRSLLPAAAPVSLRRLLSGFFRFYASFDFSKTIVCPYLGEPVSKRRFREGPDPAAFPLYRANLAAGRAAPLKSRLVCVQDPFEHSHNVAACVTRRTFSAFLSYVRRAAGACPDRAGSGSGSGTDLLRDMLLGSPPAPTATVTVRAGRGAGAGRCAAARILLLLREVLLLTIRPRPDGTYDATVEHDVFDRKPFESLYRARRELSRLEIQRKITDNMVRLGTSRVRTELRLRVRVLPAVGARLYLEHAGGNEEGFHALVKCLRTGLTGWVRASLEDTPPEEGEGEGGGGGEGDGGGEGEDEGDTSDGEWTFSELGSSSSSDEEEESPADGIKLEKLTVRDM